MNISDFIKIDRNKKEALYLQVVYQFIQAVQKNVIEPGKKVPGSRVWSQELNLHRKTITSAFDELKAEGWLKSIPSVGTFVQNPESKGKALNGTHSTVNEKKKSNFSFSRSFLLDSPEEQKTSLYRFSDGTPDYTLIKTRELLRFYASILKRKHSLKSASSSLYGNHPFFTEQLSYYLNLSCGLHVSHKNLLYAGNRQVLLYILTQLLVQTGDKVLVEEYGFYYANMVFQQAGAQVQTVPMDEEGIQVDYIQRHFLSQEVKFLYLSGRYQYPTASVLTNKRREKLIQLAMEHQFIIIEDNEDFEFSYENPKPFPLLREAQHKNIIYLGSFGKFLAPGFQKNFLIGPEDFVSEASKHLSVFENSDPLKGQALGEIIHEGDIHRYRRKVILHYKNKRDTFGKCLERIFKGTVSFRIPDGGLAFWITFHSPISLLALARKCQESGLYIPRICLYQNQKTTAMRLGFAHLQEKEIIPMLNILKEAYDTLLSEKNART